MYRAPGGVIPGEKLPPCLWQHAKRSNYHVQYGEELQGATPSSQAHTDMVGQQMKMILIQFGTNVFLRQMKSYISYYVAAQENAKWVHVLVQIVVYNGTDACHSRECGNMPDDMLKRELDDEEDDDDD